MNALVMCYINSNTCSYTSFRCKLAVKDIRVSLPSPYGDGAKTQGHALYNRPLDAHARRRKRLGTSQDESKNIDLFPVFAGAIFRFCH